MAPPAPPAAWFACAQVGGGSGAITGWCGGSPAPTKLYTAVRHWSMHRRCSNSRFPAQPHAPDVLLLGGVKHVGGDLLGIAGPQLHALHQELVLAVCKPRQRSEQCRAWRALEGGRQLLAAPTSCLPQAPRNRCHNQGQPLAAGCASKCFNMRHCPLFQQVLQTSHHASTAVHAPTRPNRPLHHPRPHLPRRAGTRAAPA